MTKREVLEAVANPGTSGEELVELHDVYHLTADGKAVHADDPAGVVVLGGKGKLIPRSVAEAIGLEDAEHEGEHKPERKSVRKKQVEDKAVRPDEDKSEDKSEEGVIVKREEEPDKTITLGEASKPADEKSEPPKGRTVRN